MNILYIGDIVGRPGRRGVQRWLPELMERHAPDIVVANGENAAGGVGATPEVLDELTKLGVHAFTFGNHVWRKNTLFRRLDEMTNLVRPANYPAGCPGRGSALVPLANGQRLGLVNVLGRVFMEPLDCPFRRAEEEVEQLRRETPFILVDIHAEATSEKVALGWHLDGRCTAVIGSHTHVQTADNWVLPQGTAYITDAGMCGPMHSVIGVEKEAIIEKFQTAIPRRFNLARGPLIFSAVLVEADDQSGRAVRIDRILLREES